jgi:hypothetical protein
MALAVPNRYDEFLTPTWASAQEPKVLFQRKDAAAIGGGS